MNYAEESLSIHEKLGGKISTASKMKIETTDDLSIAYTPGVAAPCLEIAKDKEKARTLTIKKNTVAVITDGSAVLGLGNIGPEAALPVMEGKCLLFKEYADVDAFPLCLDTQDTEEIIETVRRVAPVFGGINLEDISAPRCFEIENRLQNLGIPVFHDDQHGTAIVLLAALINSCRVTGKKLGDLKIVINGSGAAGIAIAKLLLCVEQGSDACVAAGEVILCDTKGAIHSGRDDLNETKKSTLKYTNKNGLSGTVQEVLVGADVFIGVSSGDILNKANIEAMADSAIVFAMANPNPEICPHQAKEGGAAVVGTGRSDFANQVNNVLAFPGIFRGALDVGAKAITAKMKVAAAYALASAVENPTEDKVIPSPLEQSVAAKVAKAIKESYEG